MAVLRELGFATLTGFTLPPDVQYVGVTVNPWERLYTIPFSMIKLLSPAGEIPSTTATWARNAEVREYWLDWVRRTIAMGFDGIDFRLQAHSGIVSDYANYGFNEPILERFRRVYGVEKPGERPDPLKIMKVRGEFFQLFFTDAARVIHEHGRKVQVHLRNCYEDPKLGSDHNELGFLSMPKVLLDWCTMMGLTDEVNIKDYEFDTHVPEKRVARSMALPEALPA